MPYLQISIYLNQRAFLSIYQFKYLSVNWFEKVALASYPRSGNSLLRRYIENISRVITGSDASPQK